MSRYSINRHLKKLGEKANTKTKVTPVILRHTFATHILEAGVPLDILKKLNGARKHRYNKNICYYPTKKYQSSL